MLPENFISRYIHFSKTFNFCELLTLTLFLIFYCLVALQDYFKKTNVKNLPPDSLLDCQYNQWNEEMNPCWKHGTHSPPSWFVGGTCSWSARFCVTLDLPLSGEGSGALTVRRKKKEGLSVHWQIPTALSSRGFLPLVLSKSPTGLALTETLLNHFWLLLSVNHSMKRS